MIGGYRIVHFVPDPFSGARIPIGALVSVGGNVEVVRSGDIARTQSPASSALIDFIASKLASSKDLSTLPPSAGPQAVLGPAGEIPATVADPVGWVRSFVLPQGAAAPSRKPSKVVLAKAGMRLFQQFSVSRYVREKFAPAQAWSGIAGFPANDLQKVTHWAGSSDARVLLMEPMIPGLPNVEQVQSRIFGRFSAYTNVLKAFDLQAELFVYVLQGGREDERSAIRRGLGLLPNVATVDTENENDRVAFFQAIAEAGAASTKQLSTSPM